MERSLHSALREVGLVHCGSTFTLSDFLELSNPASSNIRYVSVQKDYSLLDLRMFRHSNCSKHLVTGSQYRPLGMLVFALMSVKSV